MIDLRAGVLTSAAPPLVRIDGYSASLPLDRWTADPVALVGQRVAVLVSPVPGSSASELILLGAERVEGMSQVPVGSILDWPGVLLPPGCLWARGGTASRTTYARLFAVYGTRFGSGDGSTTFGLPDRRRRVGVGSDPASSRFSPVGLRGGEEDHVLTAQEMPKHSHTVAGRVIGRAPGNGDLRELTDFTSGLANNNSESWSAGDDAAHNNLPPYEVTNYIIVT